MDTASEECTSSGDFETPELMKMAIPGEKLSNQLKKWLKEWWKGCSGKPDKVTMRGTNPLLIPRNWQMTLCYEKAEKQDYSLLNEFHRLLETPYADASESMTEEERERWIRPGPDWKKKPGIHIMS